jgi:hypothetical protein
MDLPLADSKYWKRVHFTGIDHFTGFIYGEDRDLVTSAFVVKLEPGEKPTSQLCMERFESYSLSKFERHKGRYTPIVASTTRWRKRNIVVHKSDGRLSFFFSRYEFSAAWAAYPAYEDGCVVYATVVFWEDEKELAQRVRDHWADTAFGSLRTRGKKAPELPP